MTDVDHKDESFRGHVKPIRNLVIPDRLAKLLNGIDLIQVLVHYRVEPSQIVQLQDSRMLARLELWGFTG